MLRLTLGSVAVSHRLAPVASRGFASALPSQNKASRSGRKVKWTPPAAPQTPPATATSTPGQAGTDVGQGGSGLFEGEAAPAAETAQIPTPDQIEKEMLAAQPELQANESKEGRPNLAGSDVANGGAPEATVKAESGPQGKFETYGKSFFCRISLALATDLALFACRP
ncbi:hypothetical protein JCM3774_000507 [Rhodotorula dairenensis]